ncbi:exosome RNA helicase MTR4 [Microplitis mediator]|uniref:exosome RNA helicase MTR4 n=1 Tax=Microplitis mediator TaxID=375433 RepID=UPI002552CA12|nr:exosome RNA helicase MTR4 [Microplitis mediator]XP_057320278.1 exosome RNA helicase MTR4 [Microplitis mediator]
MDFGVDAFDVFDEENDNEAEVIPSAIDSESTDTKANVSSTKRELEDDAGVISKKQKVESILEDINLDELISQIKVHKIETIESCTHEVAVPPNHEYIPLENKTTAPAKEYKFVLDPFQKEAIQCIENNQSVLVSAHTSAGKTVVAEYAIACSLRDKQRVIYTTPIKALSNQKYREFYEEFKDVGLITGDVTINPTASVLIMTTEILRNMLYRGSEVMREVGWVIFDEIHYMRDKERGVVWEETLILLPDNVHYVFLSATIPNARQFVEWVAHLHHQPCHVVYTDYRPTPLQHYIFPAGGDGIHLVVNEDGQFKEDNFNRAMTCLQQNGDAAKGDLKGRKGGVRGGNAAQSNIFKIVKMIMERTFAPVIIFSFSKKDCEAYAMQMSQLDFNSESERKLIDEVFNNAMDVLSDEDRKLPQVENVLPLLRRGIGIHHGGLLPILKETVEILFGEGLIKALFATETFAMGLNMPARTVLFTAPRKFDGKDFRWITSGEYIQMSGRAGRRGLDEKGIVILMIDEKVSPAVGKEIVLGKADPINSAFHLTYNMVLNLLRVEEINPEYMLERSFFQFQNQAAIPGLYNKVKELQQLYDDIVVDKYNQIASYHDIRLQLDRLKVDYRNFITKVEYILKFLQPGRMVKIKNVNHLFDWGVVINFKKKNSKNPKESAVIIVDMLLHISKESTENAPIPCGENEDGEFEIVPVMHTLISEISTLRLPIPQDLRPPDNRKSVLKSIKEVKKHFPDGIPLLDPIKDMGIGDSTFEDIVRRIKILEDKLFAHPMHKDPALSNLYNEFLRKDELGTELKQAKLELKQAKSVLQMDELKCRKRVLRRMEYCTQADVIELKGRVACELNGADELLLTEMIFNGLFNALSVPQMTALLSCFVCDEKSNEMPKSTNELSGPLRQMQDLARRIAKVSSEANLELDEDSYVERFKPYLMDVVYAWCKGASFFQICKMTDIFEGSIIRCMRRLEEVLRQLSQAAKNIGNSDLENKFSEAIKLLKRDIVFAASLYL